jgi:MoxR-like ATPase
LEKINKENYEKKYKKEYKKNDAIRYNLSSETKISDLMGKYIGSKNSIAGLKLQYGPFIQAYKYGKILILDEINLASVSVLQCIEEALDNDFLSIDINGIPLAPIKKHKNFCLIATQNPNSGFYLNKRQNLGLDFLSHFQRISFPLLSKEELEKIALGLSKKFELEKKIKNSEEFIKELVNFHVKWANEEKNDIKCFTVRELAATIKNLSLAPNHFQILMIIYGSRYEKSKKEKLKETLENFPILNSLDKSEFKIEKFFKVFFNSFFLFFSYLAPYIVIII